jgi:effector-binding domain-containing protein
MQETMPKVGAYAITHNISFSGSPFVLYHKWDEANDAVIFSTAIPTSTKIIAEEATILTGQMPAFKAVKTTLIGDYQNLKEAWETTMNYIEQNNLEMVEDGIMMESYLTDPASTPNPAKWQTEIYIQIN